MNLLWKKTRLPKKALLTWGCVGSPILSNTKKYIDLCTLLTQIKQASFLLQ